MSQDPFEHIGQQLRDLEVMPSKNASFEEVMRRRKKKRRGAFFWFQRLAIVGVLGLFWFIGDSTQTDQSMASRIQVSDRNQEFSSDKQLDISPAPSNGIDDPNKIRSAVKKKKHHKKRITPQSKTDNSSQKGGIFGLFEKFNDRRNRILNGNAGNANKNNAGLKDLAIIQSSNTVTDKNNQEPLANSVAEYTDRNGSSMALSNVYDYGAKTYISQSLFDFDLENNTLDYLDWEFQVPNAALRYKKKPWYIEFSAITGSDNQIQFDPDEQMSILGTNYMAQYQLNWLRECQGIGMLGLGLQYTQWVGNGEWRKKEYIEIPQIDTQLIAINVPGLPTQFIQTFDTTYVHDVSTSTGEINYQIDKIAVPLAFRGFTRIFKTNFRYAVQIAPGVTRITKGSYFTPTEFIALEQKSQFTMGAKIGMGPMIPINPNLNIVIEPALMYQSFVHPEKGMKGRIFGGLGISMMWRLR